MKKSQFYYYKDVVFQLESNFQTIRRDLIKLLEEYKFHDCLACNRLKCRCPRKSSLRSTTVSMASSDSAFPYESDRASNDVYYNAAPPADTLPTPRWLEKITRNGNVKPALEKVSPICLNIWIRASIPNVTQSTSRVIFPVPRKVLDHVNYSWPPFPKSIWSDERLKETIARELILCCEPKRDSNGSVEAFFEYFSGNRAILKTTFAC